MKVTLLVGHCRFLAFNFFCGLSGCVIGKLGVLIDEFGQLLDGSYVKCVESEFGHVSLKSANVDGMFNFTAKLI